jgi:hypothetical protein
VRCALGGMSVIFVEHRDVASRDKARVKVLGENVDARTLTPNVRAAVERPARQGARPATTSSAATRSSSRGAPARSAVSGGMMLRRRPPPTCWRTGMRASARAGHRCATSGPGTNDNGSARSRARQ